MMTALTWVAVAAGFLAWLVPTVVGIVMTRRTWKRYGWSEMRLAYWGYVAGPVLAVIRLIAGPLTNLAFSNSNGITAFRMVGVLMAIATGAATVAIAVGMYRLARRGSVSRGE